MKKYIYLLLIIPLFIVSCNKDEQDPKIELLNTREDFITAFQETKQIANEGRDIIESTISSAYLNDELINVKDIATQIESLDKVISAKPNSSGSVIIVKQENGLSLNFLIKNENDDRLFIDLNNQKTPINTNKSSILNDLILPTGDGKVLILAPDPSMVFDINHVTSLFKGAGYSVNSILGNDASFDKFKGDFLSEYDVIYFRTHGASDVELLYGTKHSTVLMTATDADANWARENRGLSEQLCVFNTVGGEVKWAISADWIKESMNNKTFPNSWVLASACESSMDDNGSESLTRTFLNLGVAGYNGYDGTIKSILAKNIEEKMISRFTSGISFNSASDEVRNDWGLKSLALIMRVVLNDQVSEINVNLFDNIKSAQDPFYIVSPETVVGYAVCLPSGGSPGTELIYEVTVNDNFLSQVTNIVYDIDTTNEHLKMNKISSNVWKSSETLSSPHFDEYPTVSTFTFTAFDSSGKELGKGSSTFTTTEEDSSSKSISKSEIKFFRK